MDGVLVDSEPTHQASWALLAQHFGRTLTAEELEMFKGSTDESSMPRLRAWFPNASIDEMMERRTQETYRSVKDFAPIAGVREFLKHHREAGDRLGLVTSGLPPYQTLVFDTFGFTGCFDVIVTGAHVKRGKPDPEPYLKAAELLSLDPSQCVVIEDSQNGVRAGAAAGCWVVGLGTSLPDDVLIAAGADVAVPSYAALEAYLSS